MEHFVKTMGELMLVGRCHICHSKKLSITSHPKYGWRYLIMLRMENVKNKIYFYKLFVCVCVYWLQFSVTVIFFPFQTSIIEYIRKDSNKNAFTLIALKNAVLNNLRFFPTHLPFAGSITFLCLILDLSFAAYSAKTAPLNLLKPIRERNTHLKGAKSESITQIWDTSKKARGH